MRPESCAGGRGGFTLVELVVALVVAGVVVLAAHEALRSVNDAVARSRAAREAITAQAAARTSLGVWLRSMVFLQDPGPQGELTFWAATGGPLRPGAHRIRLWVRQDGVTHHQGLVVELMRLRAVAPPETLEVARQATSMSVRCLIQMEDGERWVEGCRSSGQLPRAIELRLVAPPGADPPLLGLPVVAPVEIARW